MDWTRRCEYKIFHSFDTARHICNSIWELHDEEGNIFNDLEQLKSKAVKYFSKDFEEEDKALISDQLQVIKQFPSFFSREGTLEVGKELSLEEVELVLKGFAKDKSLVPYD